MRLGGGKLGFWEIFSIGVGGMIGGGIFATLGLSLELAGTAAPLAFAFAGVIALLTGYSYAKLSSRYPSIGGTIEFLVRAFGDNVLTGGLTIMLLASYIVMVALYAYAFGSYGASMLPCCYHEAYVALVFLAIGSLTFVNLLGAVVSGRVELGLVGFKLAVLLFVAYVGTGLVEWSKLSPSTWPPLFNIIAGGMVIFLAYEGFELIANAAGDAKNTTVLRRALYSAVVMVIGVYILIAVVSAGALSPETVEKARDYALAALVEPVLGPAGVSLVVAAALASTSSAINATLYGTARMSYLVAKYGEAPQIFAKKIWRGAYEGLLIISSMSLLLALGASLEAISTAGSGGFLIVFTAVNLAAYRMRRDAGVNPVISLGGAVLSLSALAILLWRMYQINPSQITILVIMLIGSITIEYVYRSITGRKLPKVVDPRLREREGLLGRWEEVSSKVARIILRILEGAEVYLIGSHARREPGKANDIDILVVTDKPLTREEKNVLQKRIENELSLPPNHPVHIHTTTREKLEQYKQKKKLHG
ncbi:MAG: amino acid permease [Desulfurococcales archaeon]|nr:amino acid permease [Desulfurococcales archaeon]